MAILIEGRSFSEAWLSACLLLADHENGKGKTVNLNVAFPAAIDGLPQVEAELDAFFGESRVTGKDREALSINTVANTIFPASLYHPHLEEEAASRLYENYALSMDAHRRRKGDDKETYFNRLVAYPVGDERWNQLDYYVKRMKKQRESLRRSSAYEIGVSHPLDSDASTDPVEEESDGEPVDSGLRIQAPFIDKRMGSFPCLSHISLTLMDDHVHLTAIYRNQTFITRAYGNYLGLVRLTRFVAAETGAQPGEIEVVATHADVEFERFGATPVRELLERCRRLSESDEEVHSDD